MGFSLLSTSGEMFKFDPRCIFSSLIGLVFFSAVQNPEIFHAGKFCILKHHQAFDLSLFEIEETCIIT